MQGIIIFIKICCSGEKVKTLFSRAIYSKKKRKENSERKGEKGKRILTPLPLVWRDPILSSVLNRETRHRMVFRLKELSWLTVPD